MSVTSGGTVPNPCKKRGSWSLDAGSAGSSPSFRWELAAFAPPGPDRTFKVRGVDHDAQEPILANRVVRGAHFERHLVIGAKVDGLDIAPGPEVPEMDPVAILVREQIFGDDPVLELGGNPHSLVTM